MLYFDDNIGNMPQEGIDACLCDVALQRKEKVKSYVFSIDQEMSLKGYQLLQRGIFLEYGVCSPPVFEFNEHGKPHILGRPDIHFNISHCKKAVVCMISDCPVGIDTEIIAPVDWDIAKYALNSEEYARVKASPDPAVKFTLLWTMKESLIKLKGVGIDEDMPNILLHAPAYSFQTIINQTKGYIITSCVEIGIL